MIIKAVTTHNSASVPATAQPNKWQHKHLPYIIWLQLISQRWVWLSGYTKHKCCKCKDRDESRANININNINMLLNLKMTSTKIMNDCGHYHYLQSCQLMHLQIASSRGVHLILPILIGLLPHKWDPATATEDRYIPIPTQNVWSRVSFSTQIVLLILWWDVTYPNRNIEWLILTFAPPPWNTTFSNG